MTPFPTGSMFDRKDNLKLSHLINRIYMIKPLDTILLALMDGINSDKPLVALLALDDGVHQLLALLAESWLYESVLPDTFWIALGCTNSLSRKG